MSTKEITFDELLETNQQLTDEILKSQDGWDIVKVLHHGLVIQLLSTSSLTATVINNNKRITAELKDPAEFEKKFFEMFHGIKSVKDKLDVLHSEHADKSGQPDIEELEFISGITQRYSALTSEYELKVHTQHLELHTILENEIPDLVDGASTEETTKSE